MKESKFGKNVFKEKHYKKGRFAEKEKLISEFKRKNITRDMDEAVILASEVLNINQQILTVQNEISIPRKNEVLSIRTQSQLNLLTIFLFFIEQYGSVDFLSIQTYTFDKKTLFALHQLLNEGKIKRLQIIMTETANFRIPKIYALLKELFAEHKRANLVFYWLHSKINLIQCGDHKYVIDGSGNFSMNAQIEHYNIFNSPKLFDLDMKWQNDFFFSKKLRKNHEIFRNYNYGS